MRITHYYAFDNSNVHRGVHTLSMRATDAYEDAREKTRQFINAEDQSELIFVRGTTEEINLVAQSFGQTFIHSGDEVLITAMEHHSNIVPWQIVCEARDATLKVAPMNEAGEIPLDSFEKLLTDRTKILAVVHVSNSLGTVNPIAKMIEMAHDRGIPVLIDGAQVGSPCRGRCAGARL